MNAQNPNKKIFDHKAIEKKWQDYWEQNETNKTPDKIEGKQNYYTLVEFPYPSGNLHVGHWYAFAVTDIFARFQRMLGKNVLYPIGFDAFGLPAENAAIKRNINPRDWTEQNIAHMSKQLKSMGAMFDWSRMVKTIDPNYYKWTQWMFIQFMKAGLAEQKSIPANWCPSCKTVLANEQVINGKCERCDSEVEKKDLKQWTLKITKYADRLIDDLDELDWPEEIKKSQKEWIGRSEGAEIDFPVKGREEEIKVFTTRPDTIFGATYMVLAPEHELVQKWLKEGAIENKEEVENYIKEAKKKSEIERTNAEKEKSGVELKGIKAINPALSKSKRVVVIDGFGGSGHSGWKPHFKSELEKMGFDVELHALPDSEHPNFEKIMKYFEDVVNDGDIVVGHSLGGFVAMKLAEKNDINMYLVAPVTEENGLKKEQLDVIREKGKDVDAMLEMILKNPIDFKRVQSKIQAVFLSTNDRWIDFEKTSTIFDQNVIKNLGERGHFTESEGCGEIPELLEEVAKSVQIPVFIADYVLAHYGTGAIMAVPAHDERDFDFAKKYNLPVPQVVAPVLEDITNPEKETVEKETVIVIATDENEENFLVLDWEKYGWHSFIIGELQEGETYEDAALRKLKEESGYEDVEFVRQIGYEVHSNYYAEHKGVNKYAKIKAFLVKVFLVKVKNKENIEPKKSEHHKALWLPKDEVANFLNKNSYKYFWDIYTGEKPEVYTDKGVLINSGPFNGSDNEEAKQKIVDWLAGRDKMPEFQNEPMKEGVPTEERDNVSVILYDPEADKYAFLKWANEIGWKTPIGGGIKDGESLIEAAKREIKEESGYTDLDFVSYTTDHITKGYAKHKNVNRIAYWYGLYFELKSKEQEVISESEKQKHELVWLKEDEVKDFLNTEGSKYHWEQFLKFKKEGELNKKYHSYARMTKTYRLRDWAVSRQRYWGVPIPVVHCDNCGAVPEKEENLPVLLPEVEDYLPSDDGRSPLAKVEGFVNTTCPVCGAPAKRETDTLDTFVDSSWYFLRYIDPKNAEEFSSKEAQELWMPVDFYSGGAEHTTMHLLYSRFWQKALFDLGLVKDSEPYKRRLNRGLIMGPDGNKMSKSKGNVIDPDEVVEQVGSDTVRGYLAFIGPYNEPGHYPWNPDGVVSIRRFLERVYGLQFSLTDTQNEEVEKLLHKTIKKVREDSEKLKFNTAISAMMVFSKEAEKKGITKEQLESFLKLMAPFAPHIAEELWQGVLDNKESVHLQSYPDFDPEKVKEDVVKVAVQVNGKVRGEIEISPDAPEEEVKELALADKNVQKHTDGKEIKKFIYIPGRIVNIVI